jgi:hypothetical protein
VEKYRYYEKDNLVCKHALKTLCDCWWPTVEDLEALKFYLKGAEWDYSNDVRIVAMSITGEYLRLDGFDPELLALLLEIFENLGESFIIEEFADYARSLLKASAYEAIARAMGKEYDEIPDNEEIERAIKEGYLHLLDWEMIEQAKNKSLLGLHD